MAVPLAELLLFIFENQNDELAEQFGAWMAVSRRFRGFVEAHREKIRKKLRMAQDEETRQDLWRELETAFQLASEGRFMVEYEKQGSARRAPDFSVTFRSYHVFHVEVKRVRARASAQGPEAAGQTVADKLANIVCDALGQMPQGQPNVLALYLERGGAGAAEVAGAMKLLKERAERKDEGYFSRRGFSSARDFLKHYARLSAIVCFADEPAPANAVLWTNKAASRALWPEVGRILQAGSG